MHPDYLDYVVKRKIHSRAKWHDIKFLLRKLLDCELDSVRCEWVSHNSWNGWLISFTCDVDLAEIKRNIFGTLVLGDKAVFIGVAK